MKAVQLLLAAEGGAEYGTWTEEELQAEKERLLKLLKQESETEKKKTKTGGRVATKAKSSGPTTKKKTVKKKTVKETK